MPITLRGNCANCAKTSSLFFFFFGGGISNEFYSRVAKPNGAQPTAKGQKQKRPFKVEGRQPESDGCLEAMGRTVVNGICINNRQYNYRALQIVSEKKAKGYEEVVQDRGIAPRQSSTKWQ